MAKRDLPSQEYLRQILDYNEVTGIFTWRHRPGLSGKANSWNIRYSGTVAGSETDKGYITVRLNKRLYRAHRLAWVYVHGYTPPSDVDHINGDTRDNRISNLRLATVSQNLSNCKKRVDNTTGFKGVTYNPKYINKWCVRIYTDGLCHIVGRYKTKEEAVAARKYAAQILHGDFARNE